MIFKNLVILLIMITSFSRLMASDGLLEMREVVLNSGESLSLSYLNITVQDSVEEIGFAKRPGRSFMFSVIIPGAGQFYNGSLKTAIGFFVAEVGLWWGYSTLQGNANDKVDEYQAFGDENWDYNSFILSGDSERSGDSIDTTTAGVPIKNGSYYENIGKYDKFNSGWIDVIPDANDTEKRAEYRNMQADANNLFSLATTVASTVMLNHILSAAEAVWTAKKLNDEASSLSISLRAIPVRTQNRVNGRLSLTVAW